MNESSLERKHGDLARTAYVDLGDSLGEAQALLCLADILRIGDASQRAEARQNAEGALAIFERERAPLTSDGPFITLPSPVRATNRRRPSSHGRKPLRLQNKSAIRRSRRGSDQSGRCARRRRQLDSILDYYRRSALTSEARGDQRGAA